MSEGGYIGRFAPSPTGQLHIGSLLAAVASYCDARHHGGRWLVRMEDLDPPREVPGASEDILKTLERFGFEWDGAVEFQSRRHGLYRDALEKLKETGAVYSCGCSRKDWEGQAVYPGTCRSGIPEGRSSRLYRFRMDGGRVTWTDRFAGPQDMANRPLGDFAVLRADGHWAYQLAVVVDDMEQKVNHVVRGADLLDCTPGQMQLWSALSIGDARQSMPSYAHAPVLNNALGQKLSKQTRARSIGDSGMQTTDLIDMVWGLLGQDRSEEWLDSKSEGDPAALLRLAMRLWLPEKVPSSPVQLQGWGQDELP